jgi:hypothetical protein
MPRITINIPESLHKDLKLSALGNTRSLAGEIMHRLTHNKQQKQRQTYSEYIFNKYPGM